MHAENGGVIDVLIARALAAGKTAPIYHALTRPPLAEAEAAGRAIALAEIAGVPVYIVHVSSEDALEQVREARDRGGSGVRGDLPAVLAAFHRRTGAARFRGRQIRADSAAAAQEAPAEIVGRPEARPASSGFGPTIAPSASPIRKRSARAISARFPTAGRASRTGCN